MSAITLGVLLALAAYGTYSTADALVKGLGSDLSVFQIGFFTTLFSIIPAAFTKPKTERWRDTFELANPWRMHLIGITRTVAAISGTYAFVSIPLAEAYCIIFLVPVFITILSVLVLHEEVSLHRWLLVLVSFVGVVLVVRPGFRALEPGHLAALSCALFAAASVTMTRMVSNAEKRTSLFVIPGLYTLAANAVMLIAAGSQLPNWMQLGGLLVCGVLGGAGYLLQIAALATAPASRVAPIQYSQLIWALFYGAVFFGEFPNSVALAGLAVVVISGIATIFSDGTRARIAGRWAQYRGRKANPGPTGLQGPGPDAV